VTLKKQRQKLTMKIKRKLKCPIEDARVLARCIIDGEYKADGSRRQDALRTMKFFSEAGDCECCSFVRIRFAEKPDRVGTSLPDAIGYIR